MNFENFIQVENRYYKKTTAERWPNEKAMAFI